METQGELVKINQALLSKANFYETLFEDATDGILLIQEQKIVKCNRAIVEMLKYESKEELLNTHPSELSPEFQPCGKSSFEKANEMIGLCIKNGSHEFEWMHRKKGDIDFWVRVSLNMIILEGIPTIYVKWRDIDREKKLEIENEKKSLELSSYNKKMKDSINYARRIQKALLPHISFMQKRAKELFVLWKPKDILGGDIYVYEKFKDGYLIGVIDCTGHGVPGALMSMIAKTSFEKVLNANNHTNPAKILYLLDITIRKLLYSKHSIENNTSDDGLDMALCFVQKDRIVFCGAKLPLFIYKDGEVEKIKPDRFSIGYKKKVKKKFTNVVIEDIADCTFYLTTDGYLDQTGGEKGYPMGSKKFIDLIKLSAEISLDKQKDVFKNYLLNYQGENARKDDITVIGIRV